MKARLLVLAGACVLLEMGCNGNRFPLAGGSLNDSGDAWAPRSVCGTGTIHNNNAAGSGNLTS